VRNNIKHAPAPAIVLFLKTGLFDPSACFLFLLLHCPPEPPHDRFSTARTAPCKILYPSIRPLYRAQTLFNNVLHKMDDYTPHIRIYTQTHTHIRRERKTPLQFYKTIKGWRRSAPLSYVYIYIYIANARWQRQPTLSTFLFILLFSRIHSAAVLFASPPLLLYMHVYNNIYNMCVCVLYNMRVSVVPYHYCTEADTAVSHSIVFFFFM